MAKIEQLVAWEVLDSRGYPTVQAEVRLADGAIGQALIPAGASIGTHEAHELRDQDPKRYRGRGVLQAVHNITTEIFAAVLGKDTSNQTKIDRVMIELDGTPNKSRSLIVLDIFLFNSFPGRSPHVLRHIAREVTAALLTQKKLYPGLQVMVITDPINTVYGGYLAPELEILAQAGIIVITTDLQPLRDSNPIYSSLWRIMLQWLTPFRFLPLLPHPFDYSLPPVSLSTYLKAFNAKANHRKVLVTDQVTSAGQTQFITLVTSANVHDGSAAHSNVAVKIINQVAADVLKSEQAVAHLSHNQLPLLEIDPPAIAGPVAVQMLTEGKIRKAILHILHQAQAGDQIEIVMFALSERTIIRGLLTASRRGVNIRIILDPNREAFGYAKTGLPNQPVAWELGRRSHEAIQIRWYATHAEQCHSKFLLWQHGQQATVLVGSANYTRRNLRDYNLELNIKVTGQTTVPALAEAITYFDTIWTNRAGNIYTTDYATQAKTNIFKFIRYWLQEVSGVSAN